MSIFSKISSLFAPLFLLLPLSASESRFFARHVHPLEITQDGARLLAVNSAEGRLSVFAVGDQENDRPLLISEIPVGLLPVAVRLRTSDEAWVVNELSDAISIVSLSRQTVIATLQTGDEPADVAFVSDKAFVTCSRDNAIRVYDPISRQLLDTIALAGLMPRQLVVSPDGSRLHTIFLHTSNGTTILPRDVAPPQDLPANLNPALPAPPQVGKIVPVTDARIDYTVLDHDLATIDPVTHALIGYQGDLGTNLLAATATPSGDLLVANSEARNLIALEPNLRGRFALSQVALVKTDGSTTRIDVNPDPDENFPTVNTDAAAQALAQVMTLLPAPDGSYVWLAAFGSDRLARLNLADNSLSDIIDLRSQDPLGSPRSGQTVRGPRGLALHPTLPRLYVLNRLSHTLATVDIATSTVLAEAPLSSFPDLDPLVKKSRAFLFDARLSGNGSVSCSSCHIDLDRDGMAWDLGVPTGEMLTVKGALLSLHSPDKFVDRILHPMKGPMITQTLIGLAEQTKLHWRGDKASIQSFNSTFPNLLAAPPLSDEEMEGVAAYLLQLRHHPNPHLKLDRNLPDEIAGGDPTAGISVFTLFDNHCSACHLGASGTSNNLDIPSTIGSFQALKDAPLRTTYQRNHFNPTPGASSLAGFGLGSDGSHHELPISHPYSLHILDDISRPSVMRKKEKRDLAAFILAFDSGTAPAIGRALTISADEVPDATFSERLTILQAQADLGNLSGVGLIARGIYQGASRSFFYQKATKLFSASTPLIADRSANDLLANLLPGDSLTFIGVPLDEAPSSSLDRNLDGFPDDLAPAPTLLLDAGHKLTWPSDRPGWFPETAPDLRDWKPLTRPIERSEDSFHLSNPALLKQSFYRLRRSW